MRGITSSGARPRALKFAAVVISFVFCPCGGCRAAALAYTGNICGADPYSFYNKGEWLCS